MKRLQTLFLALLIVCSSFGQTILTQQVFSSSFQTVYNAFEETPDRAVALEMDAMVRAIGTYWDSLDVFYLFASHINDNDEALINWTNPGTFDATNVDASVYVALEGFTGDGAADYINLNWNPNDDAINYAQDDASIGIYVRTDVDEDKKDIGVNSGANDVFIVTRDSPDAKYRVNSSIAGSGANDDSRGFYVANRVLSTHQDLYKNGTRIINDATSSNGLATIDVFVLAFNNAGAAGDFSTKQISVAFAGKGMSQTAVTTITDAIEGYMDSNGKGVISGTTTNTATPYAVLTEGGVVLYED